MKRLGFVLVALALMAIPAFADITVTMSVSMNAGQMAVDGTTVTFLKGTKFRFDTKMMNQDVSMMVDPATKQMVRVNHTTKQVEALNLQSALAGMPITIGDAKVSVTPTGQTKEILGRACQGFNLEMTSPMTMGGDTLTMKMSGPLWLTKAGPGIAEYKAAQKALGDAGLSMSPFAQGPQAKLMVEMSKTLADAGFAMEQEVRMTIEGTGPLAQMMGQVGSTVMTIKATAISTDPIPDAKFAIPEGYTKK
jgi:hypothetical protein